MKKLAIIPAVMVIFGLVACDIGNNTSNDKNPTSITLDSSSLTLSVGGLATLTATVQPTEATNKAVNWVSSNPGVAAVSKNGTVTAEGPGSATITATTVEGGKQASCVVTVKATIGEAISKYVAIPYTGNNGTARAIAIEDSIKYSYSYGDYDFYYIYLGELRNIPMFYRTARNFSGTDWTYTFSTTDITTNTITNTVSESIETTISTVEEHTYSTTNEQKIGTEISKKFGVEASAFGITASAEFEIKVAGELSWQQHTENKKTTGFQETTSLTNTKEHAVSYTKETMESDQWNLSREKGDREGYYRYTLFSASDVYLYVIKDSTGVLYFEFREYVIPDVYFWSLDYSETPSFRKSDATHFEFDVSLLNNLPKPELSLMTPPLSPPGNISASAQSASSIIVSWDPVDGADSYEIHRSTSANGIYSLVGTSTSTSYTDEGLDPEMTFFYKIVSVNDLGPSAFSDYASTTTESRKMIRKVYTEVGDHAYALDEEVVFPATIEVYALGAGGGGQGGHRNEGGDLFRGTGGAGGGGAAAYIKFSVEKRVPFQITVGKGGGGGSGVLKKALEFQWASGNPGGNGQNTVVKIDSITLTAEGGRGGGGKDTLQPGGTGGAAGSWPTGLQGLSDWDWAAEKGESGNAGSKRSDVTSTNRGGASGVIEKGSEAPFGGSGAISNTGAEAGGGGRGGYNYDYHGTAGGDGLVVIVITY